MIVKNINTIPRPASLCEVLAQGLYKRWFDISDDGFFDPEPPPFKCPGDAFSYWWLKAWFYADQMSLDQLKEVQAFANQEMLFIKHNLHGDGQGRFDFMPMILEHINLAIAVITSKAACKSFIDLLLFNQSNAVRFELRNADKTHDTVFAIRVANLPSWALKLIGESLFEKYKSVQDKMNDVLTMR